MSDDLNRLKSDIVASLDIKGFYESYLEDQNLTEKSDGWSERVFCPIHGDKKTPNFFVNFKTGGFKCQACGSNGSVFDFWLHMQGMSIDDKTNFTKHALPALATAAGIKIRKWGEKHKGQTTPKPLQASSKEKETFLPKVNKADAKDETTSPLTERECNKLHASLNAEQYKWLSTNRGFTRATIEKYKLGWDSSASGKTPDGDWFKGRLAIPVRCKKKLIRNFRLYSHRCSPEYKVLNRKGYGSPIRLFLLDRLIEEDWNHVVIVEGELDAILLNQELERLGLSTWGAVSGTGGAKTFEPEWLRDLFGRHVYFCFDVDEPGKAAVSSHITKHFLKPLKVGKFKSVKDVVLPLDGSKESKDITDYFVKAGYNVEDFVKLCNETPEIIVGGISQDEATVEAEYVDNFVIALKDRRYIDKRVTVPVTISGQSSKTYHAIRSYKVTSCPMLDPKEKGDCCNLDVGEQIIPYGHELFIQSCMAPKGVIYKELSHVACDNGQRCTVEAIKKVVMEEYFAHQKVDRWRAEEDDKGRMQNVQELVQAAIYVLQPPDNIDIGPQNYMATGWIRTDPRSQQATLFAETLVPMEDDWKKFTLERPEHKNAIQELKDGWTVDEIMESITENVTKIYEADDILYAIILTYLSPVTMNFNGSFLRGWINCAVIGDSGTGKSASYTKIADWLELGDLFSVLSGTRTGLLYAIKQKAGEWHVSIGRYVQASGKIIAVDETQETTPEDIKRMAIAMDTGWLEVSQVASGGYRTRTRTIFLMNPKMGRTISDYSYGCDALRQCFDPMFIRRLDLAVFTSNKHKCEFYNQPEKDKQRTAKKIPARLFKALVHWAWTRDINNIIWSEAATRECLDSATEISEIFGHADDIPLVSPQDFRNNLARLSTAYAILDRNFTSDLESVIIEPRHVKAMSTLVEVIYSSAACNLRQRSKQSKRKNTLEDYDKIKDNFELIIDNARNSPNPYYRDSYHFIQLLLLLQQLEFIRKRDLKEQLGVSLTWVQKRIATLQAYNLLEVSKSGYRTTRKFNLFMQIWQEEEGVEKLLDTVHSRIGETAGLIDDTNEWLGVTEDKKEEDNELPTGTIDPFA